MAKKLYNYLSNSKAKQVETTDVYRAKRNADVMLGIAVWTQSKKGGTYLNQIGRLEFNPKTKRWEKHKVK